MYTASSDPDSRPYPSSHTSFGQKAVLAGRILRLLQEEFVVRFPAFPEVFGQLIFVPFSQTAAFGTDGIHLYYDPFLLCAEFVRSPSRVKHAYLHVHIHCLCLHMFQARNTDPEPQKNLWDLACDLEAERMTRLLLNDGSALRTLPLRNRSFSAKNQRLRIRLSECFCPSPVSSGFSCAARACRTVFLRYTSFLV